MIRKIIHIDEEKCNGCGLCAKACHEGAIGMVNGKAKLLRDDYCDGLGDCLPACPTGAITFVEREAAAYDEAAVLAKKAAALKNSAPVQVPSSGGCPGSMARTMNRDDAPSEPAVTGGPISRLAQWPIQIKLLPLEAPFYDGARLLIAADCTAFSRADFHERFMRGRITMIGCPKLDAVDYSEKLTQIFKHNDIRSITVTRMTVPCCGGLSYAVKTAVENSGKNIPLHIVTISPDGKIIR